MDIHNTIEILNAVEVLAIAGAKIAKDKKVGMEDLPAAIELAKKFDVVLEAIKDIDQIDEEVKDLDEAELIAIVSKILLISKSIKAELA
jgi:hypothetical protein